jgi:hypothetical protein
MGESAAEYARRRAAELGDGQKTLSVDKAVRMRARELGLSREQANNMARAARAAAEKAQKGGK